MGTSIALAERNKVTCLDVSLFLPFYCCYQRGFHCISLQISFIIDLFLTLEQFGLILPSPLDDLQLPATNTDNTDELVTGPDILTCFKQCHPPPWATNN